MKLTKTTARFPITNLTVPYILKDKNCMKKSKITSKAKLSDARPFPSSIMKIQHLKIKIKNQRFDGNRHTIPEGKLQ